jgi:hypothetical protein
VRYRIRNPEVLGLCDQVCGSVERQLRDLAALIGEPSAAFHPQSLE